MLRELSIKNFAIIDDLNIQFSDGLTVLSGETGAGKSIILNAVNLLLGCLERLRSDSTHYRVGGHARPRYGDHAQTHPTSPASGDPSRRLSHP